MRISDYFNVKSGHSNFDFVDILTDDDTELFIDPCLIEVGITDFCVSANKTLQDYFDSFYALYRNNKSLNEKLNLFQFAHEINATKLGYGNGDNGKAKTADGMVETFQPLQRLADENVPLAKAIDLPIFIKDFAEDCLSDMITNIIFAELNSYTVKQCNLYSIELTPLPKKYHYWDSYSHSWKLYDGNGLVIDGKVILLVPKNVVRHSYYYNTEQYFSRIILEKKQADETTYATDGKEIKPYKKDLRKNLLNSHSDILNVCEDETMNSPYLLEEHHNLMQSAYANRGLSDSELDYWVYEH